ncbi:hypothetical protein [Leifsonia aquatica]|uniref:hypothetical protein n=1 Tax=Leifsonia aquatica TaxID=144185 RepID=UPI000AB8A334|nr:hypothetical protein [Leifsonia aquatica]
MPESRTRNRTRDRVETFISPATDARIRAGCDCAIDATTFTRSRLARSDRG